MTKLVKNPPVRRETWVRPLGWEDPLEKGKATHSSILAWRIPWAVQSKESTKSWIWLSDFHFHFHTSIKLILKLGQKIWTLYKTGYPNDQRTYEQVLNLISNQRNADKHNNVKSLLAHWVIKIIKIDNTKYWWRCETAGTLIHCWWVCKLVQLFWKIGLALSSKLALKREPLKETHLVCGRRLTLVTFL